MLLIQDILDLNNNIDNESSFLNLVTEIEENVLFFNIEDFEIPITTIGYEELINMINCITYKLTELSNKELLEKIIWLKRVLFKKNKEAIMVQLMSYDYEELIDMCKEKNSELLTIPISANNKFYTEEEFNESYSYFWLDFKNTCLSYSYEELKENKKIGLINLLAKALINEKDSPYLISVTKGAINRYISIVFSYLQEIKEQKLIEQKEKEAREKALEKVLPNNIEGQEILSFVKDEIDEMIEKELNKPTHFEKPKKKEKSIKEDYDQLKLPFI